MTYSACLTTSHFSYDVLRRLIHNTNFVDGFWRSTDCFLNRYHKYSTVAEIKVCGPNRAKVENGIAEMKSVLVSFLSHILLYVRRANRFLEAFGDYGKGQEVQSEDREA